MTSPQPMPGRLAGAVIAGGKSSRMGRNKAEIQVGGLPLWRHQYDLLCEAGAEVCFVSLGSDAPWRPEGVHIVVDAFEDGGPLCGLEAALARNAVHATHLLVAAVDLPKLTAAWYSRLLNASGKATGAVGRWPKGGYFEPLAAVYPVGLLAEVRAALARQEFSLQRLVETAVRNRMLAVCEILPEEASQFANWNRPEDVGKTKG